MSYLVLARKLRPQTFEEIVGQEHVTRTLANAIAQGRIHHAFLFCGARGVGKTTAARILAKCLSCEKAPTPVPCNQCDACREITAGTSVDVQEIDGASNNSVEDIRTLRDSIRYLPVRGKKKVYIIDEVHMLSTGAFNALLKTLEEPPPHALFIFATTEVHKLPVTILSRLQRYDFKLVPTQRIAAHLADVLDKEGVRYQPGAVQIVAREAAGSVRDSLSLLEQVLAVASGEQLTEELVASALGAADRGLVVELGQAVLARDAATALRLVARASERSYDMKHLTHVFLEHLRNLVVARVVEDCAALVDASTAELEQLVATARAVPLGLVELLFDRFVAVAEEVAESPVPRYVLEVGLVSLCRVEPLEPIGDLVDRLQDLEQRLATGGAPGPGGPAGSGGGGARVQAGVSPPSSAGSSPAQRRADAAQALAAIDRATARPGSPAPAPSSEPVAAPVERARESAAPSSARFDDAPPASEHPFAPSENPAPAEVPVAAASRNGAAPTSSTRPAGPTSAPPPVAASARPKSWIELAEALFSQSPRFAVYMGGEPVRYEPPHIVVAFPQAFEAAQAKERLPQALPLMRSLVGGNVEVEIREGAGMAPSALANEDLRAKEDVARRRQEALEHPARKLVAETFGDGVTFQEPEVE